MKLSRNYWLGILLVLLVATWLGARKLNADGVWFDEWWSLYVAGAEPFGMSRSVDAIWGRIAGEDIVQGLLYPFALAGWGSAVGWTEFATRALSLFAGVIAVAGVFRLGLSLSKRPLVGLSAAALLGTSVWFVLFLHELRVYMLVVLFTVLTLLVYQRIMQGRREPRLRHYAALALVTGALVNTHYFACLFVAALGVWHLLLLVKRRPGRRWWGVMVAWLVSGLMMIPLLINLPAAASSTINAPRAQTDAATLLEIARDTLYTFSNGSIALLALLLAFSLLARPPLRGSRWMWVLALLLIPLNLVAYYVLSLNEPRYSIALLPLLALLGGYGVYELAQRRIPAVLILGVWAAGFFALEGNFAAERMLQRWPAAPIREMAKTLEGHVNPDDVIIDLLGDEDRPTLLLAPLVHYMGDFGARIEVVENSTFPGTQIFARRVREAVGDANRVWLVNDPRWELEERALFEYLLNEQNLYHCATLANAENMLIWGFERIREDAPAWEFGDGVDISVIGAPRAVDGVLQLWLAFQIDGSVPPNTYSTAVHLLDQTSQLRAQQDSGLPAAGVSCQYVELPISDLPAGEYRLHLAVYNWQTGDRLTATPPDGEATDYPYLFPFPVTVE